MLKITSVFIFVCFFMSSMSQVAKSNDFSNPFPKTINVMGSAELEIVPDEIYVQVMLSEYEKKGAGKISLETIKVNFLNACKQAGIPETAVTVASYEGYDRWYWRKRKKNPDMNAAISYQIKFSTTPQIDALVDRLDDEATQSFSIVKTSHSNMAAFRKQLKVQAIKNARDKAIYLSEAIGEKPGEAIAINDPAEGSADILGAGMLSNSVLREDKYKEAMPTQTAYKKITLRYEVNVVFALK